jgi:hypothetical protein
LGHVLKGHIKRASIIFLLSVVLLAGVWTLGRLGGRGAGVFLLMLIVLPWWIIQVYDAYLPFTETRGLGGTIRVIWKRAHDIRFLGALFVLTAFTDLYIIVANPSYSLTVFCAKPSGLGAIVAKAQSPALHLLIGYGFMRLRRWSLLLYAVYAAFGLLNAAANFACLGYGRVRTVFFMTLILFTAYIYWRRSAFLTQRIAKPGL